MISSKCKGLLGLPPEKCTVEGIEKEGQSEDGDQEEGWKQKEEEYREGKGKRKEKKEEEEGGMSEKSYGRYKETSHTLSLNYTHQLTDCFLSNLPDASLSRHMSPFHKKLASLTMIGFLAI